MSNRIISIIDQAKQLNQNEQIALIAALAENLKQSFSEVDAYDLLMDRVENLDEDAMIAGDELIQALRSGKKNA